MIKLKSFLILTAIILAVGGALATKSADFCESQQQYIRWGNGYIPVSGFGTNYYCAGSAGTCTYYIYDSSDPSSYAPCRTGTFTFIY